MIGAHMTSATGDAAKTHESRLLAEARTMFPSSVLGSESSVGLA